MARAIDTTRLADEELMELVAEEHIEAFEAVYDRHSGVAYSLAYRIVGNRVIADDVMQEAFMSIWRSRERYEPDRGSLRSWILGIVHHRALDVLRRNSVHDRRRASADGIEEMHEATERTDLEVARRDEARSIRAAIHELPEQQGQVIQLAYFGGFTHTQIAAMLEMPIGTVKGRMRLGLDKLRHHLAGEQLA